MAEHDLLNNNKPNRRKDKQQHHELHLFQSQGEESIFLDFLD